MKKNILVTITGIHMYRDMEPDEITLILPGVYFFKNDTHYISYRQTDPDDTRLITDNLIKLTMDPSPGMEVTKKGANASHLIYRPNQTTEGTFSTPFGDLTVTTTTRTFEAVFDPHVLKIESRYFLSFNGAPSDDCLIRIEVAF